MHSAGMDPAECEPLRQQVQFTSASWHSAHLGMQCAPPQRCVST